MNEYLMKNWLKSSHEVSSKPPPFNSSSARVIKNSSFSSPGPGAYNPPINDTQRTSKYRVARRQKSPIQQQFQWIFSRERSSGLTLKNNNTFLGPGAYNISGLPQNLKNSWSKANRFKKSTSSVCPDSPGPGYYDSILKSQNGAGAQCVFKSKLKKELQMTKEKPPVVIVQDQRLKDPDIEVDNNHSDNNLTKRSIQKSSFFASKVPRFLTESQDYVGPGSYQIELSKRQRFKTELPRMIRFKPSKAPMFKDRVSSQIGPGSYNIDKYALSRELQFKGYPISRQTRFNFSGKKSRSTVMPGPGYYMQNRYVYIKEGELLKRKMSKKIKNSIRMPTQFRKEQGIRDLPKRQESGQGNYNLNIFDIEFKMRKKRQYAQKLKLMDIAVAPFNSNVPRKV